MRAMNAIWQTAAGGFEEARETMIIGYSAEDRRKVNRCPEATRRSNPTIPAGVRIRKHSRPDAIKPSTRSNSRYAIRPASEVLTEPRNRNLGRRSKWR
jgi:hypothetical protein